jgi:hypothetical protein
MQIAKDLIQELDQNTSAKDLRQGLIFDKKNLIERLDQGLEPKT